MQKRNLFNFNTIGPILLLYILSPVIAELFSGSTPASRAEQLLFESVFYGSAALLIREFVRRNKLGWFSIMLFGLAFGIIEECLLLQSVFNPHFLNYDIYFGRFWGVNWVWSEIIIINHAIWSITMPVLFAELIFPTRKNQPWLSKFGVATFAVLFLLSSFGFYSIFYKMSGFTTSWVHYTVSGLLAAVIILTASNFPVKPLVKYKLKTPPPWVVGIISFVLSFSWLNLLSLVFIKEPGVPAWLVELSGILFISVLLFSVLGWINSNWNDNYRFSLGCGALYAGLIFGLVILIQSKNNLDINCQIVFILVVSIFIFLRRKSLLNSELQPF